MDNIAGWCLFSDCQRGNDGATIVAHCPVAAMPKQHSRCRVRCNESEGKTIRSLNMIKQQTCFLPCCSYIMKRSRIESGDVKDHSVKNATQFERMTCFVCPFCPKDCNHVWSSRFIT